MKCRRHDDPVAMAPEAAPSGLVTGHRCPACGAAVVLQDVGYAPLLAPEPERLRVRPPRAVQAVFDAIDAPDEIPPALHAELLAALDAMGVTPHRRFPPKRCALDGCGAWFVPLTVNARFCKTKLPLCEAVHARELRRRREAVAS